MHTSLFIRLFIKTLQKEYKDQYEATILATSAKPTRLVKGTTKTGPIALTMHQRTSSKYRRPRQVAQ
jgi:hypothetical protein